MTVIAWDGRTLAADKRMGGDYPRTVTKLRRSATGDLIGVAGWMNRGLILMDWWEAGADPCKFPAFQGDEAKSCELLIVRRDRTVWCLTDQHAPCRIEDQQHAIGSGRDFAAAAMYLGLDARQAVETACELSSYCGNGIDTLTFEDA